MNTLSPLQVPQRMTSSLALPFISSLDAPKASRADWGYVHSIETGTAVDGPGMRYLVFLAGCAFRCLYCHNPDTWKARTFQKRSLESLLSDIEKYAPFLKRAGGLTVSGGEPLGQAPFVHALFNAVKERFGLHTALDTQGHLHARLSDDWWKSVDLVLLDIKHIDDDQHRLLTGFPVQPTLDAAKRLSDLGIDLWIRHVVVPGWTDKLSVAARIADFVATLNTVKRVEILPFHQLGSHKWHDLGLSYRLEGVQPPSYELVEDIRDCFRHKGIETR